MTSRYASLKGLPSRLAAEAASVATHLAVRAAVRMVLALPYSVSVKMGRFLGLLLWAVLPLRRRLVEVQMKAALGLDRTLPLTLRVFMNQGEILVDTVRYAYMTDDEVRSRIAVEGRHNLDKALSSGRGVMMITGHIGNWEILSNLPRLAPVQFCVMADRRNDARLDALIDDIRTRCGATILPPKGKALMLVRELRKGRVIGMVVDQRGRRRDGLSCAVFGMNAPTNPAPAFIAIKGRALVLPVHAVKESGRYRIVVDEAVDAAAFGDSPEGVQALSSRMQSWVCSVVRDHPDQWFWLHSRWVKKKTFRRYLASGGDFRTFVETVNGQAVL